MPLELRCPNPDCGRTYSVPDKAAGRRVTCVVCAHRFRAPSSTGDARAGDTAERPRRETPPRDPAERPRVVARPAAATETVGRFVIRKTLGAGAFGTVFRAYDPQLDREVALKVPNPGVLDGPGRVERFLREARAAANLTHPHVVPVFDAGKDGDHYYIAAAFIDGLPAH